MLQFHWTSVVSDLITLVKECVQFAGAAMMWKRAGVILERDWSATHEGEA